MCFFHRHLTFDPLHVPHMLYSKVHIDVSLHSSSNKLGVKMGRLYLALLEQGTQHTDGLTSER